MKKNQVLKLRSVADGRTPSLLLVVKVSKGSVSMNYARCTVMSQIMFNFGNKSMIVQNSTASTEQCGFMGFFMLPYKFVP